ncbi:MAG: STAS domain-containing protein [archaeon]
MKLGVEKNNSSLIIKIKGQLDLHTAVDFKKRVKKEIGPGIDNLVLDLKTIDVIDSSGIGAILSIYKKINKKKGEIVIINTDPIVKRILELSGVLKIIKLYSSRQAALEYLSRR